MRVRNIAHNYRDRITQCIFALLILVIGIWRIKEVSQPIIFSDEYGYWADSSFLLGIDWSSVTESIAYYSYGYSMLLALVRIMGNIFGWGWDKLYQAAVALNALMLAGGYFIAVKICKRYFSDLNWFVRNLACCATFLYSSNTFYTHLTMTETTILFFFWIFLYLMMKVTDSPSAVNHILFAVVAVYMYMVHQRTIAVLITSVLVVLYLTAAGHTRLKYTTLYFASMDLCMIIHSAIKGSLQNDFYMNGEPTTFPQMLHYAFSAKTFILIAASAMLILLLWLVGKGKKKLVFCIVAAGIIAVAAVVVIHGMPVGSSAAEVDERISNNDFSGQWEKIAGLFTVSGILRLGVSIAGKWFYMAAATGLVVCFGMKDLIKHAFVTIWRVIRQRRLSEEDIWLFGVFLAVAGTFMICAIYKEGFYKADDLVHGRYNEFIMGILIILSFNSLIQDKHWIRTTVISLILIIAAGALCQYAFDEVGRTEFELCHSVMFGRVIWNYEVPYGKIKILLSYVLPLGTAFILIVRLKMSKFRKILNARYIIALLIPIITWTYLSTVIIDKYIISVNNKQSVAIPDIANQIDILSNGEDIYFFSDTAYFRRAESLQFMLPDDSVIQTDLSKITPDEDAFLVMNTQAAKSPEIQENFEIIVEKRELSLLINRNGDIMERFTRREKYSNRISIQ